MNGACVKGLLRKSESKFLKDWSQIVSVVMLAKAGT
jgi:hypothetical protein